MNRIFLSLVFLTLVGCSTAPVKSDSVKLIPQNRIYEPAYFTKANSEDVQVIFQRDRGFIGSGCVHDIYANNVKVFSMRSNEKAVIYLKPDFYIFRLETGNGICPNIAASKEADLKPNTTAEYRILMPSDFNLRITRIK